jgi:catechol 2,3-dioxygenase-like lactoylglutathione lyase family enzyme
MDTTTRFWHGVLGAPLVATIGNERLRHDLFDVGHAAPVAFFEYRGHQVNRFAKPAGVPDAHAVQFDHVSLNLPDEAALLALRQRLLDDGCEVTEVVDHGLMRSIYFTDPDGIALEASWWANAPTGQALVPDAARASDPDPVPAARKLLAAGALGTLPPTRLVDEPTGDVYRVVSDRQAVHKTPRGRIFYLWRARGSNAEKVSTAGGTTPNPGIVGDGRA